MRLLFQKKLKKDYLARSKKNEGSRHWGDWQAYFHRSLCIN
jgi:hypothetical protein